MDVMLFASAEFVSTKYWQNHIAPADAGDWPGLMQICHQRACALACEQEPFCYAQAV